MDGIGELIAIPSDFQQKQKILTYDFFMGAKYRLQKPRRRSWSYSKDVSLCGTPSEKYFLRFDNIFEGQVANTPDTCNQVMTSTPSLVTPNRAVVEDIELNFGDDKDITCIQNKEFDAVVFDVLKVTPEDIANQLTLIDLPLFQNITPEELTSCKWTSKRKYDECPNVVNYTKRFNYVSYWVTREVLSSNTAKMRAEKITHFIRIARKLLDMNSLNCLKAVVSGLQSAPIYRLNRTWNLVPKKDKEKLDKLSELVGEDSNRQKFRAFIQGVKLPCIPFMGMYLTDLTYINTLHPFTGGLDTERTLKMNAILRVIADFQQSSYEDIKPITHIQNYLKSIKYIDELQKFMEDDNYKLSLQIEPVVPKLREPKEKSRHRREVFSDSDEHMHILPEKTPATKTYSLKEKSLPKVGTLNPKSSSLNLPQPPFRSPSPDKKLFVPGHRKVRSLGSNQQFLMSLSAVNSSIGSSISSSSTSSRYNLVDDSLVDDHVNGLKAYSSSSRDSGLDQDEPESHPIITNSDSEHVETLTPHLPNVYFKLQGLLKRKTLLKNGAKPKVSSWQRYWVGLTCTRLVYFSPKYKGFGGQDRSSFRADPEKVLALDGCTVFPGGPETDYFQITDANGENVYRYRAGDRSNANLWCKYIREATEGDLLKQPANLISFEDSDDETPL